MSLNDLPNFNEVFRKDVTYNNINSHKKSEFHLLFKKYIFRNPSPPPPSREEEDAKNSAKERKKMVVGKATLLFREESTLVPSENFLCAYAPYILYVLFLIYKSGCSQLKLFSIISPADLELYLPLLPNKRHYRG